MDEALVPIGRFSRMSRLSIKALRLYDDLGLLPPAWVDPDSGYRYYRPGQANRAEAIRVLRRVDLPLEEIRALLADDDPERIGERLTLQRERLEQRLADQQRMLRFLRRLIDNGGHLMPYDVHLEQVPPRSVVSWTTQTSLAAIGEDIPRGFAAVVAAFTAAGTQPAGPPFVVYHDVIDEQTDGTIEVCVPVPPDVDPGQDPATGAPADAVAWKVVPGGTVARTTHRGPYDEIAPAYHTITGWIQDHGHRIAGPPREIYLNDPEAALPEDLLTEVQFPVEVQP